MIPFKFLQSAPQAPGAQPAGGPMGINKFFTPNAPAGAAPAAAPPPEAGGGEPDPKALAAAMGDPKLIAESPFGSSYAEGLISSAMKPQTSGNALEGMGRMAQLVSGYYHKSKDDARENERAQATLDMLKKTDPELAMVFATGDSKTRSAIMQQFVGDKVASRREARQDARADARDERRWAREDQRDEARWKREDERDAAREQRQIALAKEKANAEFETKKEQYRAAYPDMSEADIARAAAGLTPKTYVEKGYVITVDPVTKETTMKKVGAGRNAAGVAEPQRDPQTGAPIVQGVAPQVAGSFEPGKYRNATDGLPEDHPAAKQAYEEAAKSHFKREAELRAEHGAATKLQTTVQALGSALQNAPEGGPLAVPVNMARQIANQLGILPAKQLEKMSAQEIVEALNTRLAPLAKDGLPGAVSNFEMDLFKRALPGILTSKDGAKKLIEIYNWMAERTKARQQVGQDWIAMRGAYNMDGFFGAGFEKYATDRMAALEKDIPPPAWMQAKADAAGEGEGPRGGKTRVQLYDELEARKAERAKAQQGGNVPTIRNPQTGEVRELRNGEWVPKQ